MGLAQRGLFWVVLVALVSVFGAFGLGGSRIATLHGEAAAVRVELTLAGMRGHLDGRAASARMLALVADGVIVTHGGGMVVAVLDPTGLVIAASNSGLVGGRAPRAWLDSAGNVRSGHWSFGILGRRWSFAMLSAHAAAAPVVDLNGHVIGTVVVEDPATALALAARMLQPAAASGLALLLVLLPACWFAAQLALGGLARTAAAATVLVAALRKDGVPPPKMLAEAGADFAALGTKAENVLASYAQAVDAVSDAGAAPNSAGTKT